MRVTGSRVYYRPVPVPKMPPGLAELMQDLTKDVLKNNPPNIYEFCANHMKKVLEIRDGPPKQLTLEQKIKRAQNKIKQRSGQRCHKYDEETRLQYKMNNDILSDKGQEARNNKSNLKASIHHDDLAVLSEVEISQVSNNTIPVNIISDLKEHATLTEGTEDQKLNVASEEKENKEHDTDEKKVLSLSGSEMTENDELGVSPTDIHKAFDTRDVPNITVDVIENEKTEKINELENPSPQVLMKPEEVFSSKENSFDGTENINNGNSVVSHISANNMKENELDVENRSEENVNTSHIETAVHDSNGNEKDHLPEKVHSCDIKNLENSCEIIAKDSNSVSDGSVNMNASSEIKLPQQNDLNLTLNAADMSETRDETFKKPILGVKEVIDKYLLNKDNTINKLHDSNVIFEIENGSTENFIAIVENKEIPNIETHMGAESLGLTHSATLEVNTVVNELESEISLEPETIVDTNSRETLLDDISSERNCIKNLEIQVTNETGQSSNQIALDISELVQTDTEEISTAKSNSVDDSANDNSVIEPENIMQVDEKTRKKNYESAMDLETAAVTIQKLFRNFLFRRASTFDDLPNDDATLEEDNECKKEEIKYIVPNTNIIKERRTLGLSRMDTVLQTVNEEKSLSLSTDDSSTLSSAATIIQAHVRGFLIRNKLNLNNSNSLINSDGLSTSLEADSDPKNKTILNIHIVPEGGHFMSRDESMITSMDLSLDGSPPSSINLHPLSYDTSLRRKQLKREDAVQSISPPSNNSGKLSEDVDSVKEILPETNNKSQQMSNGNDIDSNQDTYVNGEVKSTTDTVNHLGDTLSSPDELETQVSNQTLVTNTSSDEMDVVTPFSKNDMIDESNDSNKISHLLHSGEFHDVVLPTKVSRGDTSVVREFKNVFAYFLLWNSSS